MNIPHPNDRQLQRYLNRTCCPLEFKKCAKHVKECSVCRTRLNAYFKMDALLDRMPLLSAPPALEDRVMQSLYTESDDHHGDIRTHSSAFNKQAARANRFRSELTNGLVAVAATYVFISSGILGKIMSINAEHWGADVQSRVAQIESMVTRISMQLLS